MRFAPRIGVLLSVAALATGVAACGSDEGGGSASAGGGGNTATPREGVTKDAIKYGLIYDQTGPQTVAQTPWAHGFLTQIKKAADVQACRAERAAALVPNWFGAAVAAAGPGALFWLGL